MLRIGILAILVVTACSCPRRAKDPTLPVSAPPGQPPPTGAAPPPGPPGERRPAVPRSNPHHARVEGESFRNACTSDAMCFVGGCSSEVCSAEEGISTTCELPAEGWPTRGASCGCVEGQCQWFTAAPGAGPPPAAGAGQGESCKEAPCASGLVCVKYFGVAGPSGPEFATCEVPCPEGAEGPCPEGQKCTTIADGPGRVCR